MTDEPRASLVILLDVDNTLIDNDRLKDDLRADILRRVGPERARRFWELYELVRSDEDYVDFPETIRRMGSEFHDPALVEQLREAMESIPFHSYLFPGALQTIAHLKNFGTVAILSDGDKVFQPLKIERSGLRAAVGGNVMIVAHKELELDKVFARFPAVHYVVVDDKPRIAAAFERECPTLFTTVLVLQGRYADDASYSPRPDIVVQHIADLQTFSQEQLVRAHSAQR